MSLVVGWLPIQASALAIWGGGIPPAPTPQALPRLVSGNPTMVLGVCITFTLPGPIKPGLFITLGSCLPSAPKIEA